MTAIFECHIITAAMADYKAPRSPGCSQPQFASPEPRGDGLARDALEMEQEASSMARAKTARRDARALADNLPEPVGRGSDTKSQLLCVMEALRLLTDEERGLTADELADVVEARCGRRPAQQKVISDVHAVADNAPFGMAVDIPSRGKVGGFRCVRSAFSAEQAMALVNMVETCKFATSQQRKELVDAVKRTVPVSQVEALEQEDVIVDWRELPSKESGQDALEAAAVAREAMRLGKRMAFQYHARGLDGREVPLAVNPSGCEGSGDAGVTGPGGAGTGRGAGPGATAAGGATTDPSGAEPEGAELVETPVALVYCFGNYYVETWAARPGGGHELWNRRLDRIRSPRVSETDAEDPGLREEQRAAIQEKVSQSFEMFGDPEPRTLFLRATEPAAKYVFDRFGPSLRFHEIHDEGKDRLGTACVVVRLGLTFYRWLFGLAGEVSLAEPPDELALGAYWEDVPAGARKPREELVADHQAALAGLKEQADKIRQAYGW